MPNSRMEQVSKAIIEMERGSPIKEAADKAGIHPSTIYKALRGVTYDGYFKANGKSEPKEPTYLVSAFRPDGEQVYLSDYSLWIKILAKSEEEMDRLLLRGRV